MSIKKTVGVLAVLIVVALVLATAAGLYLASSTPAAYAPYQLDEQEQRDAAAHFVNESINFSNRFQERKPFTFVLKADAVNSYLASLDEIEFLLFGQAGDRSRPSEASKAPFEGFFMLITPEGVTMMAREKTTGKCLSADLAFDLTEGAAEWAVRIDALRLGQLPIPMTLVKSQLDTIQSQFTPDAPPADAAPEESDKDHATVITAIFAHLDGKPFPTRIRLRQHENRLHALTLKKGQLELHFVPVE
jgi:hypothetical protein